MKRRKTMAFNAAGPTCNYIGLENINKIMNRCFPDGVSAYNGAEVFGGTDYTYKPNRGSMRKRFKMLTEKDYERGYDNDVYKISSQYDILEKRIDTWVFYGWVIAIEFFDENAVVDFLRPAFKDANRSYSFGKFLVRYSRRYDVSVLNEHLINVRPKYE